MPLHLIPNKELVLDRIPDPEAELWGWDVIALTMNGYAVLGGFEPCADLANSGTQTTLTELRCCLFFEQLRERWNGGFTTNEVLIRELLRAIRQKVQDGGW